MKLVDAIFNISFYLTAIFCSLCLLSASVYFIFKLDSALDFGSIFLGLAFISVLPCTFYGLFWGGSKNEA